MVDFTHFPRTVRLGHITLSGSSTWVKGSKQSKYRCLEAHGLNFLASVHDLVRESAVSCICSRKDTICFIKVRHISNENRCENQHITPLDNYLPLELELHVVVYHGRL